jgi:hypothetical protein
MWKLCTVFAEIPWLVQSLWRNCEYWGQYKHGSYRSRLGVCRLKYSGGFVHYVIWLRQFHRFSKAKSPVCAILFTHALVLSNSENLGLLTHKNPFFSVHCFLLPSFNLHLPQILFNIFQPSQSRASNLLLPSSLLSNILLTTFPWSILSRCLVYPNFLFLISATMSRTLCSSFNSWLLLIFHIPWSTIGPHIILSIFFSHLFSLFKFISLIGRISLPYTINIFTIFSYVLIITALFIALYLNICLKLHEHLFPAAILDFIALFVTCFEFIKVLLNNLMVFWPCIIV